MSGRILVIRRAGVFGGVERYLLDLLEGIDFERAAVWLACPQDIFSERIARLGLPVKCIPLRVPFEGGFLRAFVAWFLFLWRIRPNKIIMVYGGFTEYPLPAVAAAYSVSRGNVYLMFHGMTPLPAKSSKIHFRFLPGFGLWWYRALLRVRAVNHLARRVLAVSNGVRDLLIHDYGCPAQKIAAVYHGVDCSRFSPASAGDRSEFRRAHNLPEDAVVIVSTARLAPFKRLDRLIRAFDQLATRHENLWLLLAGDGPMRDEIACLASSAESARRIRLLGHVEDVAPVLRASDIYVLPSDTEALPLALLEAMATGLVCVASNLPGLTETIRDGENGFLAEPTEEGLKSTIERVLKLNKAQKGVLVENGRQTVLSRFEVTAAIQRELTYLEVRCTTEKQVPDQRCHAHI